MTVTVRPGDTLIIGRGERFPTEEAGNIARKNIEEQLPRVKIVLIGGVSDLAVYRDAETAHDDIADSAEE
jgi:hypothetical protein